MAGRECLICNEQAQGAPVALGQFRVYHCQCCGFWWVDRDDLDRAEGSASFQDYPHNAFLRRHFEVMKPLYRRGLQERVGRVLPGRNLAECSFLDVGCASGEYLWAAQSLGFGLVAGVEIDAVAASQARAFGQISEGTSAFPASSFDVVQIKNVVANLRDFRPFLARCVLLAKPGGAVFVDAPNEDSVAAVVRRRRYATGASYGYLRPPYIVNGFGRESLTRLVTQCGLAIVSARVVWIGHPLAPYRPSGMDPVSLLGRVWPGAGALLVVDCQRPAPSESPQPAETEAAQGRAG